MSERTLVGSFDYGDLSATGTLTKKSHTIFAYHGKLKRSKFG